MLGVEIKNYIATAKGLPFFYVVGDDNYLETLNELKQNGLSVIRTSDFCLKNDKFPSIEDLVDYFRTSDIDYRDNKFVVVGLGEYLALKGSKDAVAEIMKLKSTTLGNAHVVLLLRGVSSQAIEVINGDKKITGQQRAFVSDSIQTNLSITTVNTRIGSSVADGIKSLLHDMEDGICGNCFVKTALSLKNSMLPVFAISGAYSALKLIIKDFKLLEKWGNEEYWENLLKDVEKCNWSLTDVFVKYDIGKECLSDFYNHVSGHEYKNWLFFIWLNLFVDELQISYLKYALDLTESFDEFKNNILTAITRMEHTNKAFRKYYADRKRMVKEFPESEIATFVKANEVDPKEEIYRLTDNTLLEQQNILRWISLYGIPDNLDFIYPALDSYLKKYVFDGTLIDSELTDYFDSYKKQKVCNKISSNFMELVNRYAANHIYTKLPTRNNVVKAIPDKEETQLYWIDALGVEYMSYITALAKKNGLSLHVDFAIADLPSITDINKQFYDNWTGDKKFKEDALDNIKHDDKGGYYFTECEYPIHLAAELKVIEKALVTAATELALHKCRQFVIASDHGASRLAVIREQEEKYETDTKGIHSGRCCKQFEGCDLTNIIPENGYFVLSDYGRFKGSRAANVEVHGGASLEEIIVPIITLSLKKQASVELIVLNPNDIYVDRHIGVIVEVYISDIDSQNPPTLLIGDKKYFGKTEDGVHFIFELSDIKRAKTFDADVYDGSDLLGKISFTAKGKTGSVKNDFDDLF